jgi:hypothetical protein
VREGRKALWVRKGQLARRVRSAHKGRLVRPERTVHRGCKAPLAPLAPPVRKAPPELPERVAPLARKEWLGLKVSWVPPAPPELSPPVRRSLPSMAQADPTP